MRKYSIILSAILVGYCSARLLIAPSLQGKDEQSWNFGRLSIYCNDLVVESAYRQLLQGGADGIIGAVERFRDALRGDMASPQRWCDLGEALLEAGEVGEARHCFSQASKLGPRSPLVLFRVANFYFRVQEIRNAIQNFALVLKDMPEYEAIVFDLYTRMGVDAGEILIYGLPFDARIVQSYFRYLLQKGNIAEVQKVWNWIDFRSFADDQLAGEYADFLLKKGQYRLAAEAWARHADQRTAGYLKEEFLFNGDFEFQPSGTDFDWKIMQVSGVDVMRDSEVSNSGRWSLRICFDGKENIAYNHVSQMAFVKPGTYCFRAHVRTAQISTDEGIRFRIFDPELPERLEIKTENIRGTTDWRRLERTFAVPRQTRLVEVQVIRHRSRKFDNKICGTAWIDTITLSPA